MFSRMLSSLSLRGVAFSRESRRDVAGRGIQPVIAKPVGLWQSRDVARHGSISKKAC